MTFMEWLNGATLNDVLATGVAVVLVGVWLGRVTTWWLYK